jgi:hypothetical protein
MFASPAEIRDVIFTERIRTFGRITVCDTEIGWWTGNDTGVIRHCRATQVKRYSAIHYHFRDLDRRVEASACLARYITVTRPRVALDPTA